MPLQAGLVRYNKSFHWNEGINTDMTILYQAKLNTFFH